MESGAEHEELRILCRGKDVEVWLLGLGEEMFFHAAIKSPLHRPDLANREGIRNELSTQGTWIADDPVSCDPGRVPS